MLDDGNIIDFPIKPHDLSRYDELLEGSAEPPETAKSETHSLRNQAPQAPFRGLGDEYFAALAGVGGMTDE